MELTNCIKKGRMVLGKIVVITSGKGGVGKTTVAANIGTALAMSGKRVLIIDTDTGLRNLDLLMGLENEVLYDVTDVADKVCSSDEAMLQSARYPNLYVLPTSQTKKKEQLSKEGFAEVCFGLRERFDYVLIDCPAGIEYGFECALAPADEAIIVTIPDSAALRDADKVAGIIENDYKNIKQISLCINKLIPELADKGLVGGSAEALFTVAVKLIGIIPEDPEVLIDAYNSRMCVNNRKSPAGRAMRNIALRLDGKNVKLIKFDKKRLFKKRYR